MILASSLISTTPLNANTIIKDRIENNLTKLKKSSLEKIVKINFKSKQNNIINFKGKVVFDKTDLPVKNATVTFFFHYLEFTLLQQKQMVNLIYKYLPI